MVKKKTVERNAWSKLVELEPRLNDLLSRASEANLDCQRQIGEQRACVDRRAKMIWDENYEPDESWWGPLTEEEWEDMLVSTQWRAWSNLRQSAKKLIGRYGAQAEHPVLGTCKASDVVSQRLRDAMFGTDWDCE